MSFLDKMGAVIGVGNLDVTVECDSECHHGEQVQGVATITSGKVPQIVQGLRLGLVHWWNVHDRETNQDVEHCDVLHQRSLSLPVQIQVSPGSTHRVPFVLDIPVGATLAQPSAWHTVDVTADIPGAVDVTGRRRVFLWPIRPIADTLRALVSTTGWTLQGFQPRKARAGFVRAILLPAPAVAQRFDRMNLELALAQGRMRVFVTLDMKEGIWKTLTGGDEHDYEFEATNLPGLVASLQGLIHKHAHSP